MIEDNNYTITADLMDAMINALTALPYRDVVDIFSRFADELDTNEPKVEIIT